MIDTTSHIGLRYLYWILFEIFFGTCSLIIVGRFAPFASGSGVPHMKTIFSNSGNLRSISRRTLIGKFFGLLFSASSGLFVGITGPFIHLGAALSNTLMTEIPMFRILAKVSFGKKI